MSKSIKFGKVDDSVRLLMQWHFSERQQSFTDWDASDAKSGVLIGFIAATIAIKLSGHTTAVTPLEMACLVAAFCFALWLSAQKTFQGCRTNIC